MAKQALEGKRLNAFSMDPDLLTVVGLDTADGPEHPLYDERVKQPLSKEFVASIAGLGIIEPVKVRKDGDLVFVVAGRQRVRAARAVNDNPDRVDPLLVPVMLERGEDNRLRDVVIAENEHRVNDSLDVKLKKLERYLASGRTEHEAAVTFGVTTNTIKSWLKLQEASAPVRQAVADGRLKPTAAIKIAALPREQQAAAIVEASGRGVRGAEKAARQARGEVHHDRPGKKAMKAATETADRVGGNFALGFAAALRWAMGNGQLPPEFAAKTEEGDDFQA